jgi:hypothetical protein
MSLEGRLRQGFVTARLDTVLDCTLEELGVQPGGPQS